MLGDVLRRIRLEQGRTLADVARAARVSMPYLSELERGRKEASSEVLAAICDALRIELSDLLAEVGRDLVDRRAAARQVIRLGAIRRAAVGRAARLAAGRRPVPAGRVSPPLSRLSGLSSGAARSIRSPCASVMTSSARP